MIIRMDMQMIMMPLIMKIHLMMLMLVAIIMMMTIMMIAIRIIAEMGMAMLTRPMKKLMQRMIISMTIIIIKSGPNVIMTKIIIATIKENDGDGGGDHEIDVMSPSVLWNQGPPQKGCIVQQRPPPAPPPPRPPTTARPPKPSLILHNWPQV